MIRVILGKLSSCTLIREAHLPERASNLFSKHFFLLKIVIRKTVAMYLLLVTET